MTAMGNAVNVFTRFYHFQTTKYHEFIFIYCCPLKLKMVKTSYPKPCKIGLRAYSFKK